MASELVSYVSNILLYFMEIATMLVDKGLPVVHLDFSKAFIKIPHKRLINKSKTHRIG